MSAVLGSTNLFMNTPVVASTSYTRIVTIDYTKCGNANASNFPVLVSINHTTLKSIANGGHVYYSNGNDIRFYSDSGLAFGLSFEIQSYDPINGILLAWVKIATVSSTANTIFYMNYGNSTNSTFAGGSPTTGVYATQWKRVYHLDGNSNEIFGYNGTDSNISYVAGKIGKCAKFQSSLSSKITALDTGLSTASTARFVSFWMYLNSAPTGLNVAFSYGTDATNQLFAIAPYASSSPTANSITFTQYGTYINYPSALSTGTWYHVAVNFSTTQINVYLNGLTVPATSITLGTVLSGTAYMGWDPAGSYFDGYITQLEIQSVGKPSAWVTKQYNNQNAPGNIGAGNFLTYGNEY